MATSDETKALAATVGMGCSVRRVDRELLRVPASAQYSNSNVWLGGGDSLLRVGQLEAEPFPVAYGLGLGKDCRSLRATQLEHRCLDDINIHNSRSTNETYLSPEEFALAMNSYILT